MNDYRLRDEVDTPPKVKTSNRILPILRRRKILTKKIGVKRIGDRELSRKMASETSIFPLARPFARKYGTDDGVYRRDFIHDFLFILNLYPYLCSGIVDIT